MRLRSQASLLAITAALVLSTPAFAADLIITGTDGPDSVKGTATAEAIYGRGGNDVVDGGGGDDELDGGPGADVLGGGDGLDAVSYPGVLGTAGATVTLDGLANDGTPGEVDNVLTDVEDVFGGDGDDKLSGSAGANTIDGGLGGDRITGAAGKDALFGDEGDDVIDAQDGESDRIECGPGNDTAAIDLTDIVAPDCERISKPSVTITPGLTLNGPKRKLIISSIVSKSTVMIACASGCKPASAPTKAIISKTGVKLSRGNVAVFSLPSRIRGGIIEVGVTAPESSTTCVRYQVARSYNYKTLRGQDCTTIAKGA